MDTKKIPVSRDERFAKGIAALRKKNYDYAIELFQQTLTDNPDNPECRHHLWAAAREKLREQPFTGANRLRRDLQHYVWEAQSIVHDLRRHPTAAIASQERAILLSPASIPALLRLANLFLRHNFPCRQRATLEEILLVDQDNYPALRQLSRIYYDAKEYRNSKTAASRALKINPRDLEAENILRDIAVLGVIEEGFDNIKPAT